MAYRITPHTVKRQRGNKTLTRLLICTIVFFVAVLVKISDVPNVSKTVIDVIDAGNARETLSRIGMSVASSDNDVTQVFESIIRKVFAPSEEVIPIDAVSDANDAVQASENYAQNSPLFSAEDASQPTDTAQVSIEKSATVSLPDDDNETIPPPDIVSTEAVKLAFEYVTPVVGDVTSPFGYRDHPIDKEVKFHYGIDIGASKGTKILAFADGEVTSVLTGDINGNYFRVQHKDGIVSMYAHCDKILVSEGEKVKKGDVIAYVGDTGQVTAAHLHFQLYKDGKLIDPTPFLEVRI